MKSVVVEASTVAKAIEVAWLKADRPEEFFIRVLQEHNSGFLGFGAQKAKVVFFFKNSQKSDSLFPVVVKQKEYSNFFGNFNLKVPTEMDVVDSELNKNVSLGGQHHKKKQSSLAKVPADKHHNQNQQQRSKHSNQQSEVRPRPNNNNSHAKPVVHPVLNKIAQEQDAIIAQRALQGQAVKQIKIQPSAGKISADAKNSTDVATHKNVQVAPKMQVTMQAPVQSSYDKSSQPLHKALADAADKKEDVAKDIAKVLKKVQTQKVVANVSRSSHVAHGKASVKSEDVVAKNLATGSQLTHKTSSKSVTQKFETYEDFINSKTGIPVQKELIAEQESLSVSIVEKIETLQKNLEGSKALENSATLFSQKEVVEQDVAQAVTAKVATPRAPLKFKRRPLITENPGVSGIVRSSGASSVDAAGKTVNVAIDGADKSE